ncbi:hypothetical protein [Streptomyces sp. SLBN-134]|uniref:hypothetical protein n=1 Tax=Streptomyces sp. SLBN-134 TaxID=2768456 RepID=UPI001C92EEC9|nr:hypothetical protein [Streptomyces sp. SLBN-134]
MGHDRQRCGARTVGDQPRARRCRAHGAADCAKGLNLALADASERALGRVWKAQHFFCWMTTMLHTLPESTPFDVGRQEGEPAAVTGSTAGSTCLAEAYTGWPGGR